MVLIYNSSQDWNGMLGCTLPKFSIIKRLCFPMVLVKLKLSLFFQHCINSNLGLWRIIEQISSGTANWSFRFASPFSQDDLKKDSRFSDGSKKYGKTFEVQLILVLLPLKLHVLNRFCLALWACEVTERRHSETQRIERTRSCPRGWVKPFLSWDLETLSIATDESLKFSASKIGISYWLVTG